MGKSNGQCEDEMCVKQSNSSSVRLFPCLYHCKKMLCIQHLSEHDKYMETQAQYRKDLEHLWTHYKSIFNEEKVIKDLENLKNKLEKYQQLNETIEKLLMNNHLHDLTDNNQRFQAAIKTVQNAIDARSRSDGYYEGTNTQLKTESMEPSDHRNQPTTDDKSLSSSVVTCNSYETLPSVSSTSTTNGNSPAHALVNEYVEYLDESDSCENSINPDNDNHAMDISSLINESQKTMAASKIHGYCPITQDGVFGINSRVHGIRLCSNSLNEPRQPCRLNEHFRRVHNLTASASLVIARAIRTGLNPMTTKLFDDDHVILNIDELRTITCPITRSFIHYPSLKIANSPCCSIKQVRHLKNHLQRIHKFTTTATNIIVKAVKAGISVHTIQFPEWIHIIENDKRY